MNIIDTDDISEKLRLKGIDTSNQKISITNFSGSDQEKDLTEPANCDGFGRIRHFKMKNSSDWPANPLPIVPALHKLGKDKANEISAQVFQNSICNWRCWYCFVDFKLLSGSKKYSSFLHCDELVDMYLSNEDRPSMIDLSGGQPDLTPEWIPWMMAALQKKGLEKEVFLWSDDNLSNDFFWKYLSDEQISDIESYEMYSKVCCFKGVDEISFEVNTQADGSLFHRQLELFQRFAATNIDMYAYITLTADKRTQPETSIPKFLDRIQKIKNEFPLRIVPLKIFTFTPMKDRTSVDQTELLLGQEKAIEIWQKEIDRRFTHEQKQTPIYMI
ncbi:radical SAM protein [Pedobacter sp. CFBP9032]|uniref:radical SAM protein n=1 Tax=Pedobacter sp. CFBP9032 TaxID=3096539 RepID=UPI002A6B401E|nr:radical SAM protein [Pedobacter sp. CFBP9032]MDY0903800.1 radical SAM protein [Pedobacter sp. CFBP9032]